MAVLRVARLERWRAGPPSFSPPPKIFAETPSSGGHDVKIWWLCFPLVTIPLSPWPMKPLTLPLSFWLLGKSAEKAFFRLPLRRHRRYAPSCPTRHGRPRSARQVPNTSRQGFDKDHSNFLQNLFSDSNLVHESENYS